MELFYSLIILLIFWSLVNHWSRKSEKEKPKYPSAERDVTENFYD